MTYKQIQASHEIRMWIGQVIVPVVIGGITLATNPYVRTWVNDKICDVKTKFEQIKSKNNKSGN